MVEGCGGTICDLCCYPLHRTMGHEFWGRQGVRSGTHFADAKLTALPTPDAQLFDIVPSPRFTTVGQLRNIACPTLPRSTRSPLVHF